MKIKDISKILEDFNQLYPSYPKGATYLEICKYPYSRFEEICSRLLCFYLQPKNEHGFETLFLKSLLELLGTDIKTGIDAKTIEIPTKIGVLNEENADKKRLDILVFSDNFVIGIENKITAELYNPLDIYEKRIESYAKKGVPAFKVILSLRNIVKKEELDKMKGFISVKYHDFFDQVQKNIDIYSVDKSTKHYIFLLDFIQTLKNMKNYKILGTEISTYFFEHLAELNTLNETYNQFLSEIKTMQIDKIAEVKKKLDADKWYLWQNWGLIGEIHLSNENEKVWIESHFDVSNMNPVGKFIIRVAIQSSKKDEPIFKNEVAKLYPKYIDEGTNEQSITRLRLEEIVEIDLTKIAELLKKYYDSFSKK